MESRRFPQLEILDCIRQLVYVANDEQWATIARDNPYWQLNQRLVYSLNTIQRDPETTERITTDDGDTIPKPYTFQPNVPPLTDPEDNSTLIRPILYDNLNELSNHATSTTEPITGVVIDYKGGDSPRHLENEGYNGIMIVEVYLWLIHQDFVQTRLLRYYNWLEYALRFDRDALGVPKQDTSGGQPIPPRLYSNYADITPFDQIKLYTLIHEVKRAGPILPMITGPISDISRQAAVAIRIEFFMDYEKGSPIL